MGTLNIPCASRRQRHRGEGKRASVPCGTLALFLLSGFTRWQRGVNCCCGKAKFSFACQKRTRKVPATFEAREARTRGCSPLVTPKKLSRCKNASRFAKRIFLHLSDLLLRSRLYALAERKVLRKRNTIGGAVNRRSPKNAFSEAASIFPLRLPLRGLKGASSPFLVDPARRNRWCFSGSLLTSKENN